MGQKVDTNLQINKKAPAIVMSALAKPTIILGWVVMAPLAAFAVLEAEAPAPLAEAVTADEIPAGWGAYALPKGLISKGSEVAMILVPLNTSENVRTYPDPGPALETGGSKIEQS